MSLWRKKSCLRTTFDKPLQAKLFHFGWLKFCKFSAKVSSKFIEILITWFCSYWHLKNTCVSLIACFVSFYFVFICSWLLDNGYYSNSATNLLLIYLFPSLCSSDASAPLYHTTSKNCQDNLLKTNESAMCHQESMMRRFRLVYLFTNSWKISDKGIFSSSRKEKFNNPVKIIFWYRDKFQLSLPFLCIF